MTPEDQARWRALTLEVINEIIHLEGGSVFVGEVRIVPAATFVDHTHGTAMLLDDGTIAVRVAVDRSPTAVGDTILHEIAHVLLGPEHIDNPDHGPRFQDLYAHLKTTYLDTVTDDLPR